jgi:hypothetical protein
VDGLTITVTNYSDLSWTRSRWKVGAGQSDEVNWTDEVTQVPLEHLEAHDGQAVAAAHSEHMTVIVQDALWMELGYKSEAGEFAVRLQQLFHMFGIGPQDQWSYMDPSTGAWAESNTDTTPRSWNIGKCTIIATPVLENAGGSIDVLIKNTK